MPIYMDVHIVPGVKARDVAEAHRKDLLHQEEYECKCMTYWIDEQRETIFCLIDAPNKEAVEEMHGKAHGLIPNKIIEVSDALVESFLGRIYDPADAQTSVDGLKIFSDPSFRILLLTKVTDPILLRHRLGGERADDLLDMHNHIVKRNLTLCGGREVEREGNGFIISFSSASKGASCALSILGELSLAAATTIGFKIGLNAGEPIEKGKTLFSDTIQLASYLCEIVSEHRIAITNSIKDLICRRKMKACWNFYSANWKKTGRTLSLTSPIIARQRQ